MKPNQMGEVKDDENLRATEIRVGRKGYHHE